MKIPLHPSRVNPRPAPSAPSTPTATLSRRTAHRGLSPALYQATAKRLRYRIVLLWEDPATRSGRREEIIEFGRPDKLMDLIRRVSATPDRPLVSARLEAKVLPRWEEVPATFVAWRAAEHARKAGAR